MTSAQVVETSVNVISNSPSQDYTHPDDRTLLYEGLIVILAELVLGNHKPLLWYIVMITDIVLSGLVVNVFQYLSLVRLVIVS